VSATDPASDPPGEPSFDPAAAGLRIVRRGGVRHVVKSWPPARSRADLARHEELVAILRGLRHPALARVVAGDLGRDGRSRRLLTRWVEGRAAQEVVESGGLPAGRVVVVLRSAAAGLVCLHAHGVIHRDVAPGNVIISSEGDGALIDFGHAVPLEHDLPPSAGVVGTPGYVAPEEVLRGAVAVTRAVDVYGLGAVGYALLTGTPPALGEDVLDVLAGAARLPTPPSALGIAVPVALERAVLAALAPDPSERPDAATLQRALAASECRPGPGGPTS